MRVNSKKAAVYELNKQGRTVPEIAKLLNMDRSNVRRSLKRTQAFEQIADRQRTGRPRSVTLEEGTSKSMERAEKWNFTCHCR